MAFKQMPMAGQKYGTTRPWGRAEWERWKKYGTALEINYTDEELAAHKATMEHTKKQLELAEQLNQQKQEELARIAKQEEERRDSTNRPSILGVDKFIQKQKINTRNERTFERYQQRLIRKDTKELKKEQQEEKKTKKNKDKEQKKNRNKTKN